MFTPYYVANYVSRGRMLIEEGVKHLLISFAHIKRGSMTLNNLEELRKKGAIIMLDSGAFSNEKTPGLVTLEGYVAWLKDNKDIYDEYIVLDNLYKREETLQNLEKMRNEGLDPMPVDHAWFPYDPVISSWYRKGGRLCWGGMLAGKGTPLKKASFFQSAQQWGLVTKRLTERHKYASRLPVNDLHLLGVGGRIRKFLPYFDRVKSFDSASYAISCAYKQALVFGFKGSLPKCFSVTLSSRTNTISEELKKKFIKQKLDPEKRMDQERFCVRELKKYYCAIWDYYQKEKSKGFEHLLSIAIQKFDDLNKHSEMHNCWNQENCYV